jgi:hypothetical protein
MPAPLFQAFDSRAYVGVNKPNVGGDKPPFMQGWLALALADVRTAANCAALRLTARPRAFMSFIKQYDAMAAYS